MIAEYEKARNEWSQVFDRLSTNLGSSSEKVFEQSRKEIDQKLVEMKTYVERYLCNLS